MFSRSTGVLTIPFVSHDLDYTLCAWQLEEAAKSKSTVATVGYLRLAIGYHHPDLCHPNIFQISKSLQISIPNRLSPRHWGSAPPGRWALGAFGTWPSTIARVYSLHSESMAHRLGHVLPVSRASPKRAFQRSEYTERPIL